MVLLHTRFGTLAATVFALLLAWQVRDVLPAAELLPWLVLKVAVALARIALAQLYVRRASAGPSHAAWERAMLAMLALDGAVWGVAGWRLTAEAVTVAAIGVAALDGVSCIATFGLQVRLAATAAYVAPMLLPTALGLARRGDDIALFAAAGQLILLALLLATARATALRLRLGMLLRLQADDLVRQKDAALQLAQQRSAERDRFLAKVSHELRTPLHGMLGLVRLMRLESTDAASRRRLELVESSGVHLQGLIHDLLEASVLEAGQFTLREEVFDLSTQLDAVAELFAVRAADKGLALELQLALPRPHWVRGDAARLRQVLHNVVGNAIKFTARGRVTLHATLGERPDRVCIRVRDTGPGMTAAELAEVFQPFRQADAGRGADGVGLGLTIAREIAVAMGGGLQAESTPGEGACFVFEACLPPAAAPREPAAVPPPTQALPRWVLVAEDDEVNALIVTSFLDGLGVRNERVGDGRQAVQRALQPGARPDLVLMDCRMPVMDGLAATAEIRRQERVLGLPRLPIVALTAADADADRQACLAAGMDRVIGKPFTFEQLEQVLRAAAAPAR